MKFDQNRVFVLIDGQMIQICKKSKDQIKNQLQKIKDLEVKEYEGSLPKVDGVDRRKSIL